MELNNSLELRILKRIEGILAEAINREEEEIKEYIKAHAEDKYLPDRLSEIEEERNKSITPEDCLEYIKQLRESKK